MLKRFLLFSLVLLTLTVSGCGDSDPLNLDNVVIDPIGSGRVAHVNWNTYNLYYFQDGGWYPIVLNGQQAAAYPVIGDRPAIIVHGLGSDILSNRFNNLATSLQQSGATSIFGFEYDTLDSVPKNGAFFVEALTGLTEQSPGQAWRIVGHSMGGLVVRSALENGVPLDVAGTDNRAVLVATPNLGTPIAEEVTDNPDLVGQALADLLLNGRLEFRNADGQPVDVKGNEQGFQDLRPDSQFLATLNFEAANHHPQFEYRTLAGNDRGTDFETLDRVLGVFADDGVVDVESANATAIGAVNSAVVPYDHSAIVESLDPIVAILSFLGY
jgi:triacylglycerol esterase/lipase EstA (alpha/beta hydrolase family)